MQKFAYKAKQLDGKIIQGTLRAASEERAISLLRAHNLTPVTVTAVSEGSVLTRNVWGGSVSMKDMILFTRQTSSMIRAGVPILESLRSLEKQITKGNFKKVLQDLSYAIESGESLSNAMSRHAKVFTPFVLGIVRTGEASGRLSESLNTVADYLEQDYAFLRKVRSALIYPIFVLSLVVLLSIVMFAYVLPQLVSLFADAGVRLPWPTRVLIATTEFFQSYWLLVIIVLAVFFSIGYSYFRTPEGRYAFSTYVLRVPLINIFFRKLYLSRLTSILHTLFSSDVPALESLTLAKEAVGNRVYQRILDDTIKAIKDGASISYVWQQEHFIPPMLSSMVAVGERSGEVHKSFAEASRFFKRDVDIMLDSVTVLIEPILIIILGLGVGVVVGAVLLPIYNLVLVL